MSVFSTRGEICLTQILNVDHVESDQVLQIRAQFWGMNDFVFYWRFCNLFCGLVGKLNIKFTNRHLFIPRIRALKFILPWALFDARCYGSCVLAWVWYSWLWRLNLDWNRGICSDMRSLTSCKCCSDRLVLKNTEFIGWTLALILLRLILRALLAKLG